MLPLPEQVGEIRDRWGPQCLEPSFGGSDHLRCRATVIPAHGPASDGGLLTRGLRRLPVGRASLPWPYRVRARYGVPRLDPAAGGVLHGETPIANTPITNHTSSSRRRCTPPSLPQASSGWCVGPWFCALTSAGGPSTAGRRHG